MKLTLIPKTRTARSAISCLYVDGRFECYVLEPPDPIPAGIFDILLLHSARFNRIMPFLQSVPGHTAVEIHWGNTAADTRDCLLVGQTVGPDEVGRSRDAFDALFPKLASGGSLSIEITREAIPPSGAPVVQPEGASMPDPVPTAPSPATSKPSLLELHPKMAFGTMAALVLHSFIQIAKAHGWFDVSGDETAMVIAINAAVAYATPGA